MGNWTIVVRGTGSHHNKQDKRDANRIAAGFVKQLQEAGHSVTGATFTYGAEDSIDAPEKYLADRDAIEK